MIKKIKILKSMNIEIIMIKNRWEINKPIYQIEWKLIKFNKISIWYKSLKSKNNSNFKIELKIIKVWIKEKILHIEFHLEIYLQWISNIICHINNQNLMFNLWENILAKFKKIKIIQHLYNKIYRDKSIIIFNKNIM